MTAPVFLFPGQGSQVLGMGSAFYDKSEDVRDLFSEASEIAGFNIADLCFKGPIEQLTETKNLQPAMTAVTLGCLKAIEEYDVIPAFVAGHSLGEYAALAAARVISTADCFKLVVARGKLMQEAAQNNPGAMIAVLKCPLETLEPLVAEIAQKEPLLIANFNSPKQLVVSGSVAGVDALEERMKENRIRGSRLPVSGAWHSPLMNEAVEPFNAVIDSIEFDDPKIPVVLNVTGKPATDGAFIKSQMKLQMTSGVRWYQSIQEIWKADIRVFIELGPKGILTRMLRGIVPDTTLMAAHVIDSPPHLEAYLREDEPL